MFLDYILLFMVFFFPFIYKLGYWGAVFDRQDYGFLRSGEYLLSKRGFPKIYHFWVYIEAPILAMSFIIFYNAPFEFILYNVVFYFLLLYNVFVFGKLLRGKFHFPKPTTIFLTTTLLIILDMSSINIFSSKAYIRIYLMDNVFDAILFSICRGY